MDPWPRQDPPAGETALSLVRYHPPPRALRAPDPGAQAFQLHDLAVVHEKVDLGAVVLDVPGEDVGIARLEPPRLQAQRIHDLGRDVRAPGLHALSDPLRLD